MQPFLAGTDSCHWSRGGEDEGRRRRHLVVETGATIHFNLQFQYWLSLMNHNIIWCLTFRPESLIHLYRRPVACAESFKIEH